MAKSRARDLWFEEGVTFSCVRCGKCCRGEPGYVWVTLEEITRMAEHLGMPRDTFVGRYVRHEGLRLSLRERPNGDCVLWDEGCRVYGSRPRQCRTFPFWEDALSSEQAFVRIARGCPGVGKGRRYNAEEILRIANGLEDT